MSNDQESISLDPSDYRTLAATCRASGDELAALANLIAAQVLEDFHAHGKSFDVLPLLNVATGYFMTGELATSEAWYRLVLALKQDCADAWLNLAAICARRGDAAAEAEHRAKAFQIQRVFIEASGSPRLRVLILCSGNSSGNVPVETLLSPPVCGRIKYVIDHAAVEEDNALPEYDIVFNAVGDPDALLPMLLRLQSFCAKTQQPVLNNPQSVIRTQRQRLPETLAGIPGCLVPACIRYEGINTDTLGLKPLLNTAQLSWPLLIRQVETHGGQTLAQCATMGELEDALAGLEAAAYLTSFFDTKSADGYYRKYRVIFIGGVPMPYHLAISEHWMVHYYTANMAAHQWKLDEESRFLRDPELALGTRAWTALLEIGKRLELDYAGIDFTLLADGTLCVFEANATMLVHFENESGPLRHKNPYVRKIVTTLEHLLLERVGIQEQTC